MNVAHIDDEVISAEDFVKLLKLNGNFNELMEKLVIGKLTIHAAKKSGMTVTAQELQERVDQFRRIEGLHRAQDTHSYLDDLGVSLDEFETYMSESLYCEKMFAQVANREAIEEYFRLHSPKLEALDLSHITVESEAKARELMSLLEEEPDLFADYAREHSLDSETRSQGGYIGKLTRGALDPSIEAKLFNAEMGQPIGPFTTQDEMAYEVYRVSAHYPAKLDESTRNKVAKMVFDEWLRVRAQEHVIEVI